MKKVLIVLGMLTCLFGLTACGNKEEQETTALVTEEEAIEIADQIVSDITEMIAQGMDAYYESDATFSAIFSSWKNTIEEIGEFKGATGYEVKSGSDQVEIIVSIACENGNGKVDIVLDENLQISSVTTEATKTFGELMKGAALNMVLGMGTVFAVLILIIFIISAFSVIPKIEASMSKKKAEKAPQAAAEKAVVQVERNEELSDDLELVAVIAAAIAASEGAASTDGFVVRSIKRASTNKWQRA